MQSALRASGLIGTDARFTPLTGGVASDIWKVECGGRSLVVKRALAKLRVAADWYAPVTRNVSEAAWMRVVKSIVPNAVPDVIFEDQASAMFAMSYFPPDEYPVWKAELRDGRVDLGFVDCVGRDLARIHSATAWDVRLAGQFANDSDFHAIRLEPYLEATAAKHRDLAPALLALSGNTLRRHIALVHGDMSPKNILVGAGGPIFLDAECAVYGDPAFDLAFCLNHLLLKGLWNREASSRFLTGFDRLRVSYFATAAYAGAADVGRRAAALLPALLLARIDGKSPVEYVTSERDRDLVRGVARPLIENTPQQLQVVRDAWAGALASAS